jgi:hypothetical protein
MDIEQILNTSCHACFPAIRSAWMSSLNSCHIESRMLYLRQVGLGDACPCELMMRNALPAGSSKCYHLIKYLNLEAWKTYAVRRLLGVWKSTQARLGRMHRDFAFCRCSSASIEYTKMIGVTEYDEALGLGKDSS